MPISTSALGAAALSSLQQSPAARVLLALVILSVGLLVARVAASLTRTMWENRVQAADEHIDKIRERHRSPDKIVQYIIIVITLVLSLITINAAVLTEQFEGVTEQVATFMTALLLFVLGVILVKGLMIIVRSFINNLELRGQVETIGMSPKFLDAFLTGVKFLLYLIVVQIAIAHLGFVTTAVLNITLTAATWGAILLLAALGFFGFKDLIQNYAAGIYLRGAEVLEPGKRVRLDDESGEVRDISTFSTTVATDSGYFMLSPNKELMSKDILFKRVKAEIETLEDITEFFVGGSTPYRGPASAEMALNIFGFDVTQGDISEDADESPDPEDLGEVIETLTQKEVQTAFVEQDKITTVADEFKIWFNNDALLIPYFDKSLLFPGSEAESYVLCVGVEGEELLVVDPSDSSGGVYYVDGEEMMRAMTAQDDGGYIVLAPRGTTAFWRIKNDLIYSNISLYQQLSKSLEMQLSKILRSGRVLKHIIPDSVEDFTENWREEEGAVTRMWTPEDPENGDGGDKQIDEFTDNNG